MTRIATTLFLILVLAAACDKPDTSAPGESQTQQADPSTSPAPDEAAGEDETAEAPELALPNQGEPIDGVITAGQPTAEQFEQLREAGVRKVISLRTEGEPVPFDETALATKHKLVFQRIPIGGPDDLTKENVQRLDEALSSANGKVLLHCGSSNRVGALLALRAKWIDGASAEEAMELGKKAGLTALEPAVKQKLEE